ncbi:MAG: hypothetical protein R3F11_28470 [Verrucomicrobiales bacterium]
MVAAELEPGALLLLRQRFQFPLELADLLVAVLDNEELGEDF